jgi:hypothetical protein
MAQPQHPLPGIRPQDHRGLFHQLAHTPGSAGVKTIIENHDAWLHNHELSALVSPAMRLEIVHRARAAGLTERIATQRAALAPLLTRLPRRLSDAG